MNRVGYGRRRLHFARIRWRNEERKGKARSINPIFCRPGGTPRRHVRHWHQASLRLPRNLIQYRYHLPPLRQPSSGDDSRQFIIVVVLRLLILMMMVKMIYLTAGSETKIRCWRTMRDCIRLSPRRVNRKMMGPGNDWHKHLRHSLIKKTHRYEIIDLLPKSIRPRNRQVLIRANLLICRHSEPNNPALRLRQMREL